MLETLTSPVGTVLWHDGPTEAARETYTRGDCWALAWALAQTLPVAQLYTLGPQRDWRHVVVKVADDLYLDFTGFSAGAELEMLWSAALNPVPSWATVDFDTYKEQYLDAMWEFEPGLATVQSFADLLIESLSLID